MRALESKKFLVKKLDAKYFCTGYHYAGFAAESDSEVEARALAVATRKDTCNIMC